MIPVKNIKIVKKMICVLVTATLLQACGGGGSGGDDANNGGGASGGTAGGDSSGGGNNGVEVDTTPDIPSFSIGSVPINETVERQFTVSGVNQAITISIDGGEYAIGSGAFATTEGTVENGDIVRLRIQSTDTFDSLATATITLGRESFEISVTTIEEDLLPDDISFSPVSGQRQNTVIESEALLVGGINSTATITVQNGEYAVDGGPFTRDAGEIINGQTVQLRLSTSSAFFTETIALLSVGEGEYRFSATTLVEDASPETLTLESVEGVELETLILSEKVTIEGINTVVPLQISGGEYSIDDGEFTSEAGTIVLGQTLQLRLRSNTQTETEASMTVTVGNVSTSFSATTRSENTPPEVVFLYPWNDSLITSTSSNIRGVAIDHSGIESVRVNGELATLGEPEIVDGVTRVEWSLFTELAYGANSIEVEATDTKGNLAEDNSLSLRREIYTPFDFSVDEANNRIVGFSRGFSIVSASLDDGELTHIANINQSVNLGLSCFREDTGDIYYATYSFPDQNYSLRSYNINTHIELALGTVSEIPSGVEDGFGRLSNLVCDSQTDSLYLLRSASAFNGSDRNNVEIVEVTLDEIPIQSVFVKTGDVGFEDWTPYKIILSDGHIISHYDGRTGDVQSINLEDKSVETLVTDFNEFNIVSAVDLSEERMFYSDRNAVSAINFDVLTTSEISRVEGDAPLYLSGPLDMEYLVTDNKLLVSDFQLNAIVEVDVETGEREELVAERVGAGPHIISARDTYLSRDSSTLYVIDDGANAGNKIVAVDLATGNRTKIGSIESEFSGFASSITADEDSGTLYVGIGDQIVSVDLETEINTVIASQSVGIGAIYSNVADLIFDKTENRLLFIDAFRSALYELDLSNGVRSLISQDGVVGEGLALSDPRSAVFSPDKTAVYVTSSINDAVLSIDLVSGNRSVFINSCIDSDNVENWLNFGSFSEIYLAEASNTLYIANGGATLAYDLNTDECSAGPYTAPKAYEVTNNGELLFISFNEIAVVDMESFQTAIISR